MWYVKGLWHGLTGWWGAFVNKEDAEELAGRINGTVYHESELHKSDLLTNQ